MYFLSPINSGNIQSHSKMSEKDNSIEKVDSLVASSQTDIQLSPSLTQFKSAVEQFVESLNHRAEVLANKAEVIRNRDLKKSVGNVASALRDACDALNYLANNDIASPEIAAILSPALEEDVDEALHDVVGEIQDVADGLRNVSGTLRGLSNRIRDLSDALLEDEMMEEAKGYEDRFSGEILKVPVDENEDKHSTEQEASDVVKGFEDNFSAELEVLDERESSDMDAHLKDLDSRPPSSK